MSRASASPPAGLSCVRIEADNFKSLVGFELELAKLTCLVGLNGSGKSTVLQFIDFLGQQMRGDLKGWLDERHWTARELPSKLTNRKNVEFRVVLSDGSAAPDIEWSASFNTSSLHCTSERVRTRDASLEVEGGTLMISQPDRDSLAARPVLRERIAFSYEGSILSQLRAEILPKSLVAFREYVSRVKSLDLLSPESLRRRTDRSGGSMGLGGQRLSAFVHEMEPGARRRLAKSLHAAYEHLGELKTRSLRSGWKQLEVVEKYGSAELSIEARHVNDGLLRMIALLAELESEHRLLLFDEIENGVNGELVEFLLAALTRTSKQVVVTTHSPLILNYLDDDTARRGVVYLYRNRQGHSQSIRLFDIPSLAKKLSVMGPGEAFADTKLTELDREIAQSGKENGRVPAA